MEQFCGKDEFNLECFEFDVLTGSPSGRCSIDK